ncbi:transposase [Dyella sp. 333MFSha]|nr:transposase [Dyella sp. 333MFSha]
MSGKRYTDQFKIKAVREHGRPVLDVAQRLGVTSHSLYGWKKAFSKPTIVKRAELHQSAEVRRLQAELKRVAEERDIAKKAAACFANG